MPSRSIINIGVLGSTGRMGEAVMVAVAKHPACQLSLAGTRHNERLVFEKSDAVIDFTLPEALPGHLNLALTHKVPLVVGTTGLEPHHHQLLSETAKHVSLVVSANMSIGITLLANLVQQISGKLDENYDIEISDLHHRHKKDAPSGTSLMLGQAAAAGRGEMLANIQADPLQQGARKMGTIGFSSQRGGAVIGDHSVRFIGNEEIIEFSHRGLSRAVYANGGLRAAEWIITQKPGLYTMAHVLGI